MEIKKGEIWRIRTSESENIIRVLDDIPDTGKDQEFNAEVFEANFRSVKKEDFGEGEKILFKTKSIRWKEKIAGQYKIIQVNHKFGQKSGGWRTECKVEEEEANTASKIQQVAQTGQAISKTENVNKLNYSFNFNFDTDAQTSSHSDTQVLNSKLILLTDAATTGTWISSEKAVSANITKVELRVNGKDIWGSEFYYSLNNGVSWEQIGVDNFSKLIEPSQTFGKDIKIKCVLKRPAGWNLNPEIESMVFLYS